MDALPDELLLHILGFVGDARTLLDAVPLVCRRWHRLHREPAAWARVHLECRTTDEDENEDTSRLLLRAPASSCLTLGYYHRRSPAALRVASALRRSSVVVRSADMCLMPELVDEVDGAVNCFLQRHRNHLLDLAVRFDLESPSHGVLLACLCSLRRLERLRLAIVAPNSIASYRGGLIDGLSLPRLVKLRIENQCGSYMLEETFRGKDKYSKIVALFIGGPHTALPSLRSLELVAGLRDKAVVDAVSKLERLEELTVTLDVFDIYRDVDECVDLICRHVEDTMNACSRGMRNLRRLRIHVVNERENQVRLTRWCQEAVEAFLRHRPDVFFTLCLSS